MTSEQNSAGGVAVRVEAKVGLLERIAEATFQEVLLGGTAQERSLTYLLREASAEIQKLRNALDHYAHGGSEYGRIARDALGMPPNANYPDRASSVGADDVPQNP